MCEELVERYHYMLWEAAQKLGPIEDTTQEVEIDLVTLAKVVLTPYLFIIIEDAGKKGWKKLFGKFQKQIVFLMVLIKSFLLLLQ